MVLVFSLWNETTNLYLMVKDSSNQLSYLTRVVNVNKSNLAALKHSLKTVKHKLSVLAGVVIESSLS